MNSIHCNYCNHLPIFDESRVYCLTSCGHLICEVCARRVQAGGAICLVCNAACRFAELTNPLNDEIKSYFTDPLDTLREDLKKISRIAHFQAGQSKRYMTEIAKRGVEEKDTKAENVALRGEIALLKDEMLSMKNKLGSIEQENRNGTGRGGLAAPNSVGGELFLTSKRNTGPIFGNLLPQSDRRQSSQSTSLPKANIGSSQTSRMQEPPTFSASQMQKQRQSVLNLSNRSAGISRLSLGSRDSSGSGRRFPQIETANGFTPSTPASSISSRFSLDSNQSRNSPSVLSRLTFNAGLKRLGGYKR